MLLRQFEYLSALAREGHFGRAAEACHVSQPALSAGIRKLESDLGIQIVQRTHRFVGFTVEGRQVLMWANRILADQDSLRQELSTMRGGLSGVLRIGAIPTALPALSLLTVPFCDRYPKIRLSVESLTSRDIVHRLAEFDLDLGMTYVDGEPLGPVRTVPLYRERYLYLTDQNGEFAHHTTIRWADVANEPLCLLSTVMQNRRILDHNFADAGVTINPAIETDTISAIYAHVGTGRWSSIISHAWLNLFGLPPGKCVVPLQPPRRSYQVGLVLADRDPGSMLVRALLDVAHRINVRGDLETILRRHLPTRRGDQHHPPPTDNKHQ